MGDRRDPIFGRSEIQVPSVHVYSYAVFSFRSQLSGAVFRDSSAHICIAYDCLR